MIRQPILSHFQAATLLDAQKHQQPQATVSLDLHISDVTVELSNEGVVFPGGEMLSWRQIEQIKKANTTCFLIEGRTMGPIQVFSQETNRMCSLLPTKGAPTMLIAGFTMHRIVDIDPMQDTRRKIATLKPVVGRTLDTATGLGYTAIAAAQTADEVITIELDPGAQSIAHLNPWSQPLFDDARIKQLLGDAYDIVPTFDDASFDRIIHDPPMFSLAGQLYAGEFYRQLYRVLKKNGRLFHYIGNLESRSGGTVARGALKRLKEAGFTRITPRPAAFGVLAYK